MKVEIGKKYFIYGKLPGMKQYRPYSGEGKFAINIMFANIYYIESASYKNELLAMIKELNITNNESWELRIAS